MNASTHATGRAETISWLIESLLALILVRKQFLKIYYKQSPVACHMCEKGTPTRPDSLLILQSSYVERLKPHMLVNLVFWGFYIQTTQRFWNSYFLLWE